MTRARSQIQHDYKTLVNPPPGRSRNRTHRFFLLGLTIPLVVLLGLLSMGSGEARVEQVPLAAPTEPAEAGQQLADAALTASRLMPLPLPEKEQEIAAAAELAAPVAQDVMTLTIRKGDTLDQLFAKRGLSRSDLARILTLDEAKDGLTLLRPGDEITVYHEDGRVQRLIRQLDETRTLQVGLEDELFAARIEERPVEIRINHATAVIDSSLFLAGKAAGVSDTLIMNLAGIFAWDVDFVLDIRQGDRFSVLYEEVWQDGEYLRDGVILAAMFDNQGDVFKAVRYADPDGEIGYFTPEGRNVKKAFLRAPIAFTPRVTSNFNPKRYHPVHKRVRPHRGVDYGGPVGTPIKAAGDGKVIFRGRKGGYGNTIILQHGGNITTLYAHMSKFNGKARVGRRVKQGQVIGYVGATGTVTGAHLHYEYRVNGVHRNPRTVKLPQAKPIPGKFREDFKAATAPLLNQLDVISQDLRLAAAP